MIVLLSLRCHDCSSELQPNVVAIEKFDALVLMIRVVLELGVELILIRKARAQSLAIFSPHLNSKCSQRCLP
jgi:hypothetical protein